MLNFFYFQVQFNVGKNIILLSVFFKQIYRYNFPSGKATCPAIYGFSDL